MPSASTLRKVPVKKLVRSTRDSGYIAAERKAIQFHGEAIVTAWLRGRKMPVLRAQYGISQPALEALLQERIGKVA